MANTRKRFGPQAVYDAAKSVKENGFRKSESVFTPGQAVWTVDNLKHLVVNFVDNPDLSGESYFGKLQKQLAGCPDSAIQLMAEIHFLHMLIVSHRAVSGASKKESIERILSWMSQPIQFPLELEESLAIGVSRPGTYFATRRDLQIGWLIACALAFKERSEPDQATIMASAVSFYDFVTALPGDKGVTAQRNALLHLFFPEHFESILSADHRRRILEQYKGMYSDAAGDENGSIAAIRQALTPEFGDDFSFYDERIKPTWIGDLGEWDTYVQWAKKFDEWPEFNKEEIQHKETIAAKVAAARSAFLKEDSAWVELLKKSFGSPNNMTHYLTNDSFLKWVEANWSAASEALRILWDTEPTSDDVYDRIDTFVASVPSKVSLSTPGSRLSIASFLLSGVNSAEYPVFRPTPFTKSRELLGLSKVPIKSPPGKKYRSLIALLDQFAEESQKRGLKIRDHLHGQSLMFCITKMGPLPEWSAADKEAFLEWRGVDGDEKLKPVSVSVEETLAEPASADQLAESLFIDEPFLNRAVDLLEHQRQIIFYGPPGTGKTFVARKLADHIVGEEGTVTLVQFHPSYAYEDFVQGFRPNPDGSGFSLRDGPLMRAATEARNAPQAQHILIIDEINRGNIAKLFGELYFLLEYRDAPMTMQYSDEDFKLPSNLWIIGTMNTADRSIARIDSALRRRFSFIGMFPSEEPIKSVLRRWLVQEKPDLIWLANVVERANELLSDADSAIGPSYFMKADLDDEWIERIWEHSVMPYLSDYYFADPDRLADFELARLRSGVGPV